MGLVFLCLDLGSHKKKLMSEVAHPRDNPNVFSVAESIPKWEDVPILRPLNRNVHPILNLGSC